MKLSALIVTLSSIAAFAQEAAEQAEQQPGLLGSPIIMMVLIFGVMWLFFIRPQSKERKKMDEMRKALKKGDRVMTSAGILGTVTNIDETGTTVTVRTGSTTFIDFDKQAILRVINAEVKAEEKKDEKK
ncbi:preprotein translocase subunit YajC [Fibrobacter sp.]|uniref:preprotein translocase subunit YajC n=1 Tax=Fibrobacter sp. TaxID=35828 RepID=UPI0025BE7187|nr:preprotein translocase subunit YajC [Fibrobacter sp.]MBR2059366.1 preprotein translocase subunit YajC [Fibrobacter sp.]MBR2308686.1 preprotein translocase subunit YajC [Fibrobacter sp.]MBR4008237.1 preprotein translocase subunit YajC [Fibrobacter sp.]